MYLRLFENTASTAPSTIVTAPSARIRSPQRVSPGSTCAVSRSTPKMPAFVSTPDSSAETGAGATGCACGSQMCSGNTPALAPKPNSTHSAAAHSARRFSTAAHAARSSEITSVPVRW